VEGRDCIDTRPLLTTLAAQVVIQSLNGFGAAMSRSAFRCPPGLTAGRTTTTAIMIKLQINSSDTVPPCAGRASATSWGSRHCQARHDCFQDSGIQLSLYVVFICFYLSFSVCLCYSWSRAMKGPLGHTNHQITIRRCKHTALQNGFGQELDPPGHVCVYSTAGRSPVSQCMLS
jgi:hypothetical protein